MDNNKNSKKILSTVCIVLAFLLVFASVFVTGYILDKNTHEDVKPNDTTVATVDEITTAPPVTTPDETEPEEIKIPKTLAQVLERGGYTTDDLNFGQLIVVDSIGVEARVMFFEREENEWDFADNLSTVTGYVGENGVKDEVLEGDLATPSGLYNLGTGFGIMDDPGTKLDYVKVTEESFWVDDPESEYYNQYVEGTDNMDWQSAEQLSLYSPDYNYAVFIEYNVDPVVKGAGSAFFLRVGREATRGSVAIPNDKMIDTLRWLDKDLDPHIMIINDIENN